MVNSGEGRDKASAEFGHQKYFSDVLEWYFSKYLSSLVERAWLCVCLVVLMVFLVFLLWDIYSLFPTSRDFTFVKYTDRYSDEFLRIKKLSTSNEKSEEELLASYLAGQYVGRYESYVAADYENQFNFVKNNSSRRILLAFKNYMERDTVSALVAQYKTDAIVLEAIVEKVELLPQQDLASLTRAAVEFKVKCLVDGVVTDTQSRKVIVAFSLSNIKMAAAGIVPFEFTVHSYQYLVSGK